MLGDACALRDALVAVRPGNRVAGVTTTSEFYLTAAARLAKELGLPGEVPRTLADCRDKGRLREILGAAGAELPRFAVCAEAVDVVRGVERVGLPCVVKPVDDSGSTDVLLCRTAQQVVEHASRLLARTVNGRGQPRAGRVLVEEYLDGRELSVEMFTVDGEHRIVAVVAKEVTGTPHFVEAQHIVPAPLGDDLHEEVVVTVAKALTAMGIRRGPTHTEVKLTPSGPAAVEINPRLAGGMIPELLRLVTGWTS